jgi:tRNA (cytidine/uridine-2'-O-)-methyltransferase
MSQPTSLDTSPISDPPAEDRHQGLRRLHVVLVEPEIAANVGAIGRTCVALGAELWLVRPLGFHLDDRRRRRAGLDYWADLLLHVVDDLEEALDASGPARAWFFSTRATQAYHRARYETGDALVFGSESRGLPERVLESNEKQVVRIPMTPHARCLNLACSVAAGLCEATRQIGFPYCR